jgi:hypothetical protein
VKRLLGPSHGAQLDSDRRPSRDSKPPARSQTPQARPPTPPPGATNAPPRESRSFPPSPYPPSARPHATRPPEAPFRKPAGKRRMVPASSTPVPKGGGGEKSRG